jgi:hypothetical protein
MPFPLDPTFQFTGAPFLTAPDGTTAPDIDGDEVDLTGIPLAVAPQSNALQAGTDAVIASFAAGELTISNLHDMGPGSVGRLLSLDATNVLNRGAFPISAVLSSIAVKVTDPAGVFPDTNSGATANITVFAGGQITLTGLNGMRAQDVGRDITISGAATVANNGTFPISSFIDATSVKVTNAAGVAPDANNGAISWTTDQIPVAWSEAINGSDFVPGDPLSFLVDQQTPFNEMQSTFGPATGGGSAILPTNQNVPPDNSQSAVTGKGTPPIAATAPTTGPVTVNDPQNPVRTSPSSAFLTNMDVNSLAYGLNSPMPDGPAVRTPTPFIEVQEPGATSATPFPSGRGAYPVANPVTFSRS